MSILVEVFRERFRATLFWILGFVAFGVMMILFFNEFPDLSFYDEIIAQAPDVFRALVGELTTLSTLEGFLNAELFGFMLPVMFAILGITLATSLIGKEEAEGTLELLLARPISRSKIYTQKALSIVIMLGIMAIATWFGIVIPARIIGLELNAGNLAAALFLVYLLGLNFSLLAYTLSSIFNRGVAVGVTTVLFVVSYFVANLAASVEVLKHVDEFSLFYYYKPLAALTDSLDPVAVAILVIPAIFFFFMGRLGFIGRDISSS